MLKQSLLVITLLIGVSFCAHVSQSQASKYAERLNQDPTCKDDNLKAVRSGFLDSTKNRYQVLFDYCYNTTKGQVEGVKVYLGDNKVYEEPSKWEKLLGFSDSIEEDFQHFMTYFIIDQEMTKFMKGKEGVPNFELTGIIEKHLIGDSVNLEKVWNTFFAREETIKVWNLLKEDIAKFSEGKGSVEVKFRFSGRPYTLSNDGEKLQLFGKMPDKFPIPDSFFVTVSEGSKKFDFVVLNEPEKVLYSAFKFENCKKIDWLKVIDTVDSQKLLKCK